MKKMICKLYIKMFLKRLKTGQKLTFEDHKRFLWCIRQLLEV